MTQFSFGSAQFSPNAIQLTGSHFGVVVKKGDTGGYSNFGRNLLGQATNDASVATVASATATNTTVAMSQLGIGSIRYPGGTEGTNFDFGNPLEVAGLQRALVYCAKNNVALNLTISDRPYLDPVNANNDAATANMTAAERTAFQYFIRVQLLDFADSVGAKIESIHIGNEFSGKEEFYGGQAWKGYANVAALMINELHAVLSTYDSQTNSAQINHTMPKIVIQPPNWTNNSQQAAFFEILKTAKAMERLDAVDLHGDGGGIGTETLKLGWDTYFGTGPTTAGNNTNAGYEARLENIISYWRGNPATAAVNTDLVEMRVDAWSYDGTASGAALDQAALGLLQMYAFSKLGIVSATNYLGYGTDSSALVGWNSSLFQSNLTTINMTAGGQLFALMSANLKATQAITFSGAQTLAAEATATSLTRAFLGDNKAVVYVINHSGQSVPADINTSSLTASLETFVGGIQSATAQIVGVATGASPTVSSSLASLTTPTFTVANLTGGATDFTLKPYEIGQISIVAKGVFGTASNNNMTGGTGVDVLHGLAGNDILNGLAGNDILVGGLGNDSLLGDVGNDVLYGGAGGDVLNGGTGTDMASYAFAMAAVTASLATAAGNTGDAAGDSYIGIEGLTGTNFGDVLTGDTLNNVLSGGAGNDTLSGGAGNDSLDGGDGDDTLIYTAGNDTLNGGAGTDTLIVSSTTGINISLSTGAPSNLFTFLGIENVTGGTGADYIVGSSGLNTLMGGAGNDTVYGYGGNDTIYGNDGIDKLSGGTGNDRITGGAGVDQLTGGDGNDDFVFNLKTEGGDTIDDFSAILTTNDDRILIVRAGFDTTLALGQLASDKFVLRTTGHLAVDANDRFIFCQQDKTLWFDADGTGAGVAVLVADLQDTAANMTASDIWII